MKKYIAVAAASQLAVIAGAFAIFYGLNTAQAVVDTQLSASIRLNRLRVSYTDIKNAATTTDPEGFCTNGKRVVLLTVPGGGEANSIVSKGHTTFTGNGINDVDLRGVWAEQNGVQISTGKIATNNSSISDPTFIANMPPNPQEFMFYDDTNSWDIVAYFCGYDFGTQVPLTNLTGGDADFFISVTK